MRANFGRNLDAEVHQARLMIEKPQNTGGSVRLTKIVNTRVHRGQSINQRLGLARAMLGEPRVMILDEPTNGMDPRGIGEVRALIQNLKSQGVAILMSSHLLAEVSQVCDTVGILSEGRLVHAGSVTPDLESIYLSVTRGGVH